MWLNIDEGFIDYQPFSVDIQDLFNGSGSREYVKGVYSYQLRFTLRTYFDPS